MSIHIEHINQFLKLNRIAVAGVSGKNSAANTVYKKFKQTGYEVIPVNPHMNEFEGEKCYPSVLDIKPLPEGVFLFTHPEVSAKITDECIQSGIKHIWMHNMMGFISGDATTAPASSSVSIKAIKRAEKAGISIIAGSCPLQFIPPVDFFHTCVHWICNKTGKLG